MLNKEQCMQSYGFNNKGEIFCVSGGNTYEIKDILKLNGFNYSKLFGWYAGERHPVPAGYYLVKFAFDDIFEWSEKYQKAFLYKDSYKKIQEKLKYTKKENKSEYMGECGDRLKELAIEIRNIQIKYNSYNKPYYIYTFVYNDNKLIWITTSDTYKLDKGKRFLLDGTITAHYIYNNTKVTKLSRCILKPQ